MRSYSKIQIATAIAILFHLVGLVGILFFKSDIISGSTPLHLLLMAGLILYTQPNPNLYFLLFFLACVVGGFLVEYLGIHTGIVFGNYQYGEVLGPKIQEVPAIIGINWFIITYICGSSIYMLLENLRKKVADNVINNSGKLRLTSMVVDGATLAVFLDWLMEPVAVKLGYWKWLGNGDIPVFNYVSWFVVSMIFMLLYQVLPFQKHNKFALNLLLIQAMFFLLLRTFL